VAGEQASALRDHRDQVIERARVLSLDPPEVALDTAGTVTVRYDSRLYHIGLGRAHKGRAVKLLIADQSVRVIDLNGELIRELTLDPSRDYQPLSRA
jgi:hypothetical protein